MTKWPIFPKPSNGISLVVNNAIIVFTHSAPLGEKTSIKIKIKNYENLELLCK